MNSFVNPYFVIFVLIFDNSNNPNNPDILNNPNIDAIDAVIWNIGHLHVLPKVSRNLFLTTLIIPLSNNPNNLWSHHIPGLSIICRVTLTTLITLGQQIKCYKCQGPHQQSHCPLVKRVDDDNPNNPNTHPTHNPTTKSTYVHIYIHMITPITLITLHIYIYPYRFVTGGKKRGKMMFLKVDRSYLIMAS